MCDCLESIGQPLWSPALPHAGMWRAAEDTMDDFMGRLAVVPMVLEARGLECDPQYDPGVSKCEGQAGR